MKPTRTFLIFMPAAFNLLLLGCGDKKPSAPAEPPVITYKKEKDSANTLNPPVINITDTLGSSLTILYVKDSALNSNRLGIKLAAIYNKQLANTIKQNKLTITGPRMAWYRSTGAPFFFEAGVPVNKKQVKLSKKVKLKTIASDSLLVAHYYGPYDLTYLAYDALKEWMKEKNIKASGPPYEIYVGAAFDEEGKPIDPYKVRTDIVFPH